MTKFRFVLIEDEEPAADRMERMVTAAFPGSVCVARLVSVKSSVEWLSANPHPDLIFMDIQLADGNSFEILQQIKPSCPIIFTTAYDTYAIDAFKYNSIDYLLKPIKKNELIDAVNRFYERSKVSAHSQDANLEKLIIELGKGKGGYQKRILVRYGDIIKAVDVSDIAYFYTENKINFLCTFDSRSYAMDLNLDDVERSVDPAIFFRINRQFIVNYQSIHKMVSYSKSRVKLELVPPTEHETIVSTERSPLFKSWLTGGGFEQ